MFNWTVNGVNQLAQQWFWYRVGSTGPESSINTLSLLSATASDTNGNGLNDTLFLSYGSPSLSQPFRIDVTYSLQGTTASGSSIGETINITNNSTTSPLDFHFFQYSHFTLGNVAGAETEALLNPNTVRVLGTGNLFSETVVTRAPDHYQLGLTTDSPNTLTRLNDANPTTLSDGPTTRGPGDATWAFQWDQSIAPGATFTISKDKSLQLVPEPVQRRLAGRIGLPAQAPQDKNTLVSTPVQPPYRKRARTVSSMAIGGIGLLFSRLLRRKYKVA
jgi:hypothetical protein